MVPNILVDSGDQLSLSGREALHRWLIWSRNDANKQRMFTNITYILFILYFLKDKFLVD